MNRLFLLTFFCGGFHLANCPNKSTQVHASTLSIGLETNFPAATINNISSFGLGASINATAPLASFAVVTISDGYTHYFGKSNYGYKFKNFNTFPLKAGIRVFTGKGFYFEPQVGYTIFTSERGSSGAFACAANIGCVANKNIDISIKYEAGYKV